MDLDPEQTQRQARLRRHKLPCWLSQPPAKAAPNTNAGHLKKLETAPIYQSEGISTASAMSEPS
jgi:hypothetical protein